MDFVDIFRRVQNMRDYGMTLSEIHDELVAEGVAEMLIYFAYRMTAQPAVQS